MPEVSAQGWAEFLSKHPDAHILQTPEWGELKSSFGWRAVRLVEGNAGAQVLIKQLPLGFNLAYLPKGPLGAGWERLLPEIDKACRRCRAILLIWEPDRWQVSDRGSGEGDPPAGFRRGVSSVQPPRTVILDITGDEDEVLSRMKQKTRYNMRLAQKRGVVVHPLEDVDVFYRLMQITGDRDQFGVHSREYYQRALELFRKQDKCELLVAEYEGIPLAGLMVFANGGRAWYFYGASSEQHRDVMPNYLLQWESIRWARSHSCHEYDLWGVPDRDEETLEAEFLDRSDGLWGVYRFKRGFGGILRRSEGPWERVYNPLPYTFYRRWAGRQAI